MDVILNESCLNDRNGTIDEIGIINFLSSNINSLLNKKYKVFTKSSDFKLLYDLITDNHLKTLLQKVIHSVSEISQAEKSFYYYHFRHQDFGGLPIDMKDVSQSSLAIATDKIISGDKLVVLNIPISHYCSREHIPIVKSSHISKNTEILVNIPCYSSAEEIEDLFFLINDISPIIVDDNRFVSFKAEFSSFKRSSKLLDWKPKTYLGGQSIKLDPRHAFPITMNESLKTEIRKWEIHKGSTEENIASYRVLGAVIAKLNLYTKNPELTKKYGYDIYEGGRGQHKLLISIDVENGALEVIDRSGTHIGVYSYTGDYKKHYTDQKELDSHSLLGIQESMFLFK